MIFLLSFTIEAKEMTIIYKRIRFSIQIDAEKIKFNDQLTTLSLEKKKCNEHIFNSFTEVFNNFLIQPFSTEEFITSIKISMNHKYYFERVNTNRAKFFLNFGSYLEKLKTEEMISCKS